MKSMKRWTIIACVALSIAAPAIALFGTEQPQTVDSALIAQGPIKQKKDKSQSPTPYPGGVTTADGYTWGG